MKGGYVNSVYNLQESMYLQKHTQLHNAKLSVGTLLTTKSYRQTSIIRHTKTLKLKCFLPRLAGVFAQATEARW